MLRMVERWGLPRGSHITKSIGPRRNGSFQYPSRHALEAAAQQGLTCDIGVIVRERYVIQRENRNGFGAWVGSCRKWT